MSNILKLNLADLGKGVLVAVLTAVIQYLASLANLLSADPETLIKTAVLAGLAYIMKNLLSDNEGKVLGRWG